MDGGPRQRVAVAARTLYLDRLAATTMAGLAEGGVRAVLLKGASFRDLFYDVGEPRAYADVDLLVSPAQATRAGRILQALGFEDTFAGAAPSETSPIATEYRGTRAVIDLHRSLPGVTLAEAEAWAVLSQRTESMALSRGVVEVLNAEGRCLHAALNAVWDGAARSQADLRRAVLRVPMGTWQEVVGLAEELGALPWLAAALALSREGDSLRHAMRIDVPIPVGLVLRSHMPPVLSIGLHRLLTTPGLRAKAAFLARRLVPTPSGLRFWSPLASRGRTGMALAYAWRPFYLVSHGPRAALGLVRAWRRSRGVSRSRPSPPRGP